MASKVSLKESMIVHQPLSLLTNVIARHSLKVKSIILGLLPHYHAFCKTIKRVVACSSMENVLGIEVIHINCSH